MTCSMIMMLDSPKDCIEERMLFECHLKKNLGSSSLSGPRPVTLKHHYLKAEG